MRNFIVIIECELSADDPVDAYNAMAELIAHEEHPVHVQRANKVTRAALEGAIQGATRIKSGKIIQSNVGRGRSRFMKIEPKYTDPSMMGNLSVKIIPVELLPEGAE